MNTRVDNVIIRGANGTRFANSLVLGRGVPVHTTPGGLPELVGELIPSGGDDTANLRAAVAAASFPLRLGPGTFLVSGPIQVPANRAFAGRGPDATIIQASHAGPVFELAGDQVRIEELTVRGPGKTVAGSVAVANVATAPSGYINNVTLRGLKVRDVQKGIVLKGSNQEISGVTITLTGTLGIEVTWANGVVISDVDIDGISGTGAKAVHLERVTALDCRAVRAAFCTLGIHVNLSHGLSIAGSRMLDGGTGVMVETSSLVNLSGVEAAGCTSGFLIQNCAAVTLAGCGTVHGNGNSLTVRGGSFGGYGVAVNGYYAEMSVGNKPFVVVDGGAQGVVISAIHHRGFTSAAYEVDVSAAGGRVVFLQHDFDPTLVNSGGNFVQL
jgi:nitrous oxidase accessory protein NosD